MEPEAVGTERSRDDVIRGPASAVLVARPEGLGIDLCAVRVDRQGERALPERLAGSRQEAALCGIRPVVTATRRQITRHCSGPAVRHSPRDSNGGRCLPGR